jgi:hypothetical protein
MTRSDVELIVRSVMRDQGMQSDIRRVALFERDWKIEVVDFDGAKTLTVPDSSPQSVRQSVMRALDVEPA